MARRGDGSFLLTTASGDGVEADAVVNACGLWSQRLSEKLGIGATHPAFVIEHHYCITEPLEELATLRASGGRVPVLRDLAASCYVRQEQDGLLVGPYEPLPRHAVKTDWLGKGPPDDWAWDLFPDALDRLEDCLATAMTTVGPPGVARVASTPRIGPW